MAQDPPAYCVANFVITDEASFAAYIRQATPIMRKYGGRVVASDRNVVGLEGDPKSILVIIEFPSMKTAKEFYHSPDYAVVKPMRLSATEGGFLLLSEGLRAE